MHVVGWVFESIKVDGNIIIEQVLKLLCKELLVRLQGKLLQGDR